MGSCPENNAVYYGLSIPLRGVIDLTIFANLRRTRTRTETAKSTAWLSTRTAMAFRTTWYVFALPRLPTVHKKDHTPFLPTSNSRLSAPVRTMTTTTTASPTYLYDTQFALESARYTWANCLKAFPEHLFQGRRFRPLHLLPRHRQGRYGQDIIDLYTFMRSNFLIQAV